MTWDLSDLGSYGYKLVNLGSGEIIPLVRGGEYSFEICNGEVLSFELIAILGDFDSSGIVNFMDFAIFANQWLLKKLSADTAPGRGDGIINFVDWAVFANGWQGDINDLSVFASQWLQWSAYNADIAPIPGGDGVVNVLDLAVFAENWLTGVE